MEKESFNSGVICSVSQLVYWLTCVYLCLCLNVCFSFSSSDRLVGLCHRQQASDQTCVHTFANTSQSLSVAKISSTTMFSFYVLVQPALICKTLSHLGSHQGLIPVNQIVIFPSNRVPPVKGAGR